MPPHPTTFWFAISRAVSKIVSLFSPGAAVLQASNKVMGGEPHPKKQTYSQAIPTKTQKGMVLSKNPTYSSFWAKEMYWQGSSYAAVQAWLGTSLSSSENEASQTSNLLPTCTLWSWNCSQKHSWALLITFSPSINLRCPKSRIMLKWASIPHCSFSSYLHTAALPFPKRPGGRRNEPLSLNITATTFQCNGDRISSRLDFKSSRIF